MRALAISGSLRRDSYNTQLLRAAAELAPSDLDVELYSGLAAIPPYDSDEEARGKLSVADLKRQIAAADVVLVATPEYNSRTVLGVMGARVIEGEVAVPNAHEHFDADGHLVHGEARDQLAQLLADLVAATQPAAAAA
jgi:NAD(P)H-dependent FMN reductase